MSPSLLVSGANMDKAEIKKALLQLDITNNEHWTEQNLPRLDALKLEGVKRSDLAKVAPQFTRLHPTFELPVEEQEDEDAISVNNKYETNLNMESSEFGGDDPLEHGNPSVVPLRPKATPELQSHLAEVQKQLDETVQKRQQLADLEARLRREVDETMQQMGLEVSSAVNQSRIMAYLAHTQQAPQPMAAIDKAFQPNRDPAQQRPQRTNVTPV
jgi:hypothetical protein